MRVQAGVKRDIAPFCGEDEKGKIAKYENGIWERP